MRFWLVMAVAAAVACARSVPDGDASLPAQRASRADSASVVTLERTPCFGFCPTYRVELRGDGSVVFVGTRNVDSVGTFRGRVPVAPVHALFRLMDSVYFRFDDRYAHDTDNCRPVHTDAPIVITSFTTATRSKSVHHYLGCPRVPALDSLEVRIDSIAESWRWIGRR